MQLQIKLKNKVVDILELKKASSAGHCGFTITQIHSQLNGDLKQLKQIMNELFKENIINIRHGIHGKLIFLK